MNNQPQDLNQYISWLKKTQDKPHLYDNDEWIRLKKELYQAKKLKKILQEEEKSFMGFGYQRKPMKPVEVVNVEKPVDVEVVEDTDEV